MSSQDDEGRRVPAGGSCRRHGDPPPCRAAGGPATTTPPARRWRVEQDLDALLADAQKERDEYLELAQRTKADFENFRKRVAAEVQAARAVGRVEVAREVIGCVDNLERALEAAGQTRRDELAEGVEMVLGFRGLRETLSRNGIEAVDPKGEKFDPNRHEALSTMPVEGTESGTVVEVMQKGYRSASS